MAEPFSVVSARTVAVPVADIDTDQIIPARFLTTTSREGLGAHLFADVRGEGGFAAVLEDPRAAEAQVLVAGDNFGCGSSREHAPWALRDFGFRVVVSTSFADIFASNALKNGLLPVVLPAPVVGALLATPWTTVRVDLEREMFTAADGASARFTVEPFARYCLLRGLDPLDFLMQHEAAIGAYEAAAEEGRS